jgi:hypothetical protein
MNAEFNTGLNPDRSEPNTPELEALPTQESQKNGEELRKEITEMQREFEELFKDSDL